MHLLHLSCDLLGVVADYMQTAALSHVCSRTWQALRWRHLLISNYTDDVAELCLRLTVDEACLHTLNVRLDAPALHWLGYSVSKPRPSTAGPGGAQALACLKDARALHTLSLHLMWNNIGANGARSLAALAAAPVLHSLHLSLWHNSLGNAGAEALAGLRAAPALHTLTLDLGDNCIGDGGATPLRLPHP